MHRAALPLVLLASACASNAAPISYGGAAGPSASAPAQTNETGRERSPARAAPIDWAAGEGRPLSDFALRREDVQPFDPESAPRTHRVGENESLYDIATRYQVPLRALIDQNNLEPPYALAPGRVLELPPPRVHVVERGERFEDIARANNVDPRSLALLNRMEPPYNVRAGDRIVLPAMARAYAEPAAVAVAPAQPAAGARFAMPLRGEIVARFGPRQGGQRSDGVEIAGREGASIGAAADGEVVYAGDDLPGYGVLVLIAHSENYVTAYGYARRALVREGQSVRAGEAIAELGGRPDGRARLMFQVRLGGQAVDPAPLLGLP